MAKRLHVSEIVAGSYAFLWYAPTENLQVEDGHNLLKFDFSHGPTMPSLSDKWLIRPHGQLMSPYAPLRIPVLHRKFARLRSDDSIVDFSQEYGFLTNSVEMLTSEGGGVHIDGEPLSLWKKESESMGVLLALWDLVRSKEAGKLGQIIIWPDNNDVHLSMIPHYNDGEGDIKRARWELNKYRESEALNKSGYDSAWIASKDMDINADALSRWQMGNVIEPAYYYVCRELNKHLRGHVAPQVRPLMDNDKAVYLFPDSLLAALWLMFLNEIAGIFEFIRCKVCDDWKEVMKSGRKEYCSDACRKRAYEKRQSEKQKKTADKKPS